jgi:hypothetical protein
MHMQVDVPKNVHVWKIHPKPKTAKGHPYEIQWRRFNLKSQRCREFEVGLCDFACVSDAPLSHRQQSRHAAD